MNASPDDWLVRAAEMEMNYDPERDNASFEDSERFEDDSEGSFLSSEESINQNWRGWSHGNHNDGAGSTLMPYQSGRYSSASSNTVVGLNRSNCSEQKGCSSPASLVELSAKICAKSLSFEQLELCWREINKRREESLHDYLIPSYCIPENLILTIIQQCFPSSMEDIRLYCCLANGNGDEFNYGDFIYQCGAVNNVIQIGFLITAKVSPIPQPEGASMPQDRMIQKNYDVALQLDRGRVIGCKCTCGKRPFWCMHVISVCHYRLYQASSVEYRKPIWDSISELSHDNLKKMVQFFINTIPWEYLSTAQRLLDELKASHSEISTSVGVPDPTDGGHDIIPRWAFSEPGVHTKIRNLLHFFCVPAPVVFSDVGAMTSPIHSQHPIAQEWRTLRKCFRAKEPEGLWNLISIVKEMLTRRDANAISVLRIITEECLANSQVLLWWYVSRLLFSNEWIQISGGKNESCTNSNQMNAALLLEEIVSLWKLASLNPAFSVEHRNQLFVFLQNYHRLAANRIWTMIKSVNQEANTQRSMAAQLINSISKRGQPDVRLSTETVKFTMKEFPGFHSALHVCCTLSKVNWLKNESSIVRYSLISEWDTNTFVPLQLQTFSDRTQGRKNRRNRNNHRNRHGRHNVRVRYLEEESSESGQESEQDAARVVQGARGFPQEEVDSVLAASYLAMEPLEIRFTKCESMYAHGYTFEAVDHAREIAKTLRMHMPGVVDSPTPSDQPGCSHDGDGDSISKDLKINIEKSVQTLDILEKAVAIAQILKSQNDNSLFSFILGILMSPKQPMATKFSQVKEYHIECELIDILRSLHLGDSELLQLRRTASILVGNVEKQVPSTVPHVALSHYIFDKLSYTVNVCEVDQTGNSRVRDYKACGRLSSDDDLCLHVALDALGSKLLVPEDEFPMLSEVVRRQKGDLCIALLNVYKDSKEKIGLIMDKYLDPHVHRMYSEHASNAAYFIRRDPILKRNVRSNLRPQFPYTDKYIFMDETLPDNFLSTCGKLPIKRWRLKKLEYPTEAQAQYMTELSKRIVEEAGGNQNPVVFAPLGANVVQGPHRTMRLCGILVAMYGLGLHNKVSSSWQTRTYNCNTSWINSQSIEIGSTAVEMIRELWIGHYTASEAAALADKASCESRDPIMVKEAAELALSVLSQASTLSSSEILKALLQCKEQDSKLLETACLNLRDVYLKNVIPPEALWKVAHYWEDLHVDYDFPLQSPNAFSNPQAFNLQPPNNPFQYQYSRQPVPYSRCSTIQMGTLPHYPPHMSNPQYISNYNMHNPVRMPNPPIQPPPPVQPQGQGPVPLIHQSHSAPQLSSIHQNSEPETRIHLAHEAGIKAIESLGIASLNEDSRTKYAVTSLYTSDIQWLFRISGSLGAYYVSTFLETAARNVMSPFTLYNLATDTLKMDKKFLLSQLVFGPIPQSAASKQYYQNFGQVRITMLNHNYLAVTAELFERAIEQFYVGIMTKLNFSRFTNSDREEASRLLQAAWDACQCIPAISRNLFEDLCRQAKKQKAGKREMSGVINELTKRSALYPQNVYK